MVFLHVLPSSILFVEEWRLWFLHIIIFTAFWAVCWGNLIIRITIHHVACFWCGQNCILFQFTLCFFVFASFKKKKIFWAIFAQSQREKRKYQFNKMIWAKIEYERYTYTLCCACDFNLETNGGIFKFDLRPKLGLYVNIAVWNLQKNGKKTEKYIRNQNEFLKIFSQNR